MTAWLLWIAYRLGQAILFRWLPASSLSRLEAFTWGCGLGLGILAYGTFAAGALHLWYPAIFWAVLIPTTLLLYKSPPPENFASLPSPFSGRWHSLWTILLSLFLILFFLGDLFPEVFYDSLHYHLAVPNLYRLHHGLINVPTLLYSNFVLTLQYLYGLVLTLGNEGSVKLLHGALGGLIVLTYAAIGQRFFSRGGGILSSLIFLSMPLVMANIATAGIDVGLCFFQLAAAYVLLRALDESSRSWLRLAGLFTGLGASCKYTTFPYIPIACLLILWRRRWDEHQPWKPVLQDVLHFLVPALLPVIPYLFKNAVFHGNPLYPFGGVSYGTPRLDINGWQKAMSDTGQRDWPAEFQNVKTILHLLGHPWFISMTGSSNTDFVGPLYLLLLPLLFMTKPQSSSLVTLKRYGLLLWGLWFVTTSNFRYGLPAIAILTPVFVEALATVCALKWPRRALLGTLLVGLLINLQNSLLILYGPGGWQVLGGMTTKENYLAETHSSYPTPPYEGIAWMNGHLPATSKILFSGEARSYYSELAVVPTSVYDADPLMGFARQAENSAQMAQRLRREGITHVFLNFAEAVRTEGYGQFKAPPAAWTVFRDFWSRYIELVWKKEDWQRGNPKALYVYRFLTDDEAAHPHPVPPNPFERWQSK